MAKRAHKKVRRFNKSIVWIAITGGPCGGKTSLINMLRRIMNLITGYLLILVPEAATILNKSNITFKNAGGDSTYQEQVLNLQMQLEESARIAANNYLKKNPNGKVAVICDRGLLDGAAYYGKNEQDQFDQILSRRSITRKDVYARYDAVIHLVSAAVGARDFYTTSDGTPRSEGPEEAAALDAKCIKAWEGHPNFIVIDNSFKFYDKLERAVAIIYETLGVEARRKTCRRFIVEIPDIYSIHDNTTYLEVFRDKTFFIKQKRPDVFEAVKVRTMGNNNFYFLNTQRWDEIHNPNTGGKSTEPVFDKTDEINQGAMMGYINKVDTSVPPIEKITYSFHVSDEISCELDLFKCNQKNAYLRAYFDCEEKDIHEYMPKVEKVFNILREVEYSKEYSEYGIASTHGDVLN